MKKIIYSKYANDRAREFALRTDILKDENGKKYVQKKYLDGKGKSHVLKMQDSYEMYKDKYSRFKFFKVEPVSCKVIEGGVEFEFLVGQSLDSILREYIINKKVEDLKEFLIKYLSLVTFEEESIGFETSERFERIFGVDGKQFVGVESVFGANVDMLPANIIVNDKWNIIDYEWVFLFNIPAKFIKYRCLHYWFHENKGDTLLSWCELKELIQLTDEEEMSFALMESNFQRYLSEGITPTREIREIIDKNIVTINEVNEELLKAFPLQIFFDTGTGFNEKESIIVRKTNFHNHDIDVSVRVPYDVKAIRIDPIEKSCVCKINGVQIDGKVVEYISNGTIIRDNQINYETSDPQIIIQKNVEKNSVLDITIKIDENEFTCKYISESYNELEDTKTHRDALIFENQRLLQMKEFLQAEYEKTQMQLADSFMFKLKYKVKKLLKKI